MKVVVGMSGGVDSAVAAYLLKKQGYEVVGLFMKNWDSNINNDIEGITDDICPQEKDYIDAKKVCDELSIPLYRVDFIKEYWDSVFTYFLEELKKGRTPNPDIMCNKYIKFDKFIEEARKLGGDKIATGHYARMIDGKLYKGVDDNKDQTYFLSQVTKEQFKDILFPVGDYTKEEIRNIAKENDIPVFDKKDSTGICFIGERNYQRFVQNYLKGQEGDIIDISTNEVIGKHHGLMNYTIGQRKNVGISGNTERRYVVGKNVEKNILYVAFKDDNEYLYSDEAIIENFNFISDKRPIKCAAKFRYRQKDNDVEVEYLKNNEIIVKYTNVSSVTPGQACVLYLGDECIGGGFIKEVRKNNEKLWYL